MINAEQHKENESEFYSFYTLFGYFIVNAETRVYIIFDRTVMVTDSGLFRFDPATPRI